jgi:hypothetical protein
MSIFVKLAGTIAALRSRAMPSNLQYAINQKDGAARAALLCRADYASSMCLLRFDISNAFNTTNREAVYNMLASKRDYMPLLQYFTAIYQPSAGVFVYGPDGRVEELPFRDGIQQGDSTSALLFCLHLDTILARVIEAWAAKGLTATLRAYMDDITVSCLPSEAGQVEAIVIEHLRAARYAVSDSKCAHLCASDANTSALPRGSLGFPMERLAAWRVLHQT